MNTAAKQAARRATRRPAPPNKEASIRVEDKSFDSPTKKPSLKERTCSWGDLSVMLELDSPTVEETASHDLTTKQEMLSMFGFKQSHCDFCWKEMDISQAQLQKCMCSKKYFCKGCSKSDKVQRHQQECALERFEKRQHQQSDGLSSRSDRHVSRTAKKAEKNDLLSQSDHVPHAKKKTAKSKSISSEADTSTSPRRELSKSGDNLGRSIRALVSPRRSTLKEQKKDGKKKKQQRQTSLSGLHEALSFHPSPTNKTKRRASNTTS